MTVMGNNLKKTRQSTSSATRWKRENNLDEEEEVAGERRESGKIV